MKDYKRLTERDEFGNADIIGVDSGILATDLSFDELNKLTFALNKFADLEDKIESGELVDRNEYLDRLMAAKGISRLTDKEIAFFAKHNARVRGNADAEIARLTAENTELRASLSKMETVEKELRDRLDKAVELPCKVGDTVYSIFEFPNEKAILKGTCEHISINIFSGFPEIFIKLVFETNELLFPRTYNGNGLNNIFLLRSEAEARLKELKEKKQ